MSGSTFLADVAIEYYRMTYHKDGPDYVREFVHERRGAAPKAAKTELSEPANHQAVEIAVSPEDLKAINEFMEPIK